MAAVAAFVLPGVDPKFASMKAIVAALDFFKSTFGAGDSDGLEVWHEYDLGRGILRLGGSERRVPFCNHHAAVANECLARDEVGAS